MFLLTSQFEMSFGLLSVVLELTAMPANAPAAMFWIKEKFGGRDS